MDNVFRLQVIFTITIFSRAKIVKKCPFIRKVKNSLHLSSATQFWRVELVNTVLIVLSIRAVELSIRAVELEIFLKSIAHYDRFLNSLRQKIPFAPAMESKDGDVATAASEPSETSHLLLLLGEPLRCGARQAALDFIRQGLRRWDGGVVGGADLSAAMDAVANAKPKPSKIERTPGMNCNDESFFSLWAFLSLLSLSPSLTYLSYGP